MNRELLPTPEIHTSLSARNIPKKSNQNLDFMTKPYVKIFIFSIRHTVIENEPFIGYKKLLWVKKIYVTSHSAIFRQGLE